MTPQLRFPEFTDKWQVKKLGDIVKFARGGTLSKDELNNTGRYPAIHYGQLFTEYNEIINYVISKTDSNTGKTSEIGDILMPTSDVTPQGLARASVVNENGVMLGGDINVLKPNYFMSSAFLSYMINSQKKKIMRLVSGTTVRHVYASEVSKAVYFFPSKPEQEKIADFLTAVDERIRLQEQKLVKLEQYKRGVMQQIFSQKIRFKDESGNEYPEWEEKKLGDLEDDKRIKLGRGNVISKTDISENPGSYPIFSSSVKNNGLFGRYGKYMFDEELITWSVDGGGHFFYRPKSKFSVTNVSGWMRILDSSLNHKFISLQLQMLHEKQVFDYTSKAHPSVIRKIYMLSLPVIEEQQKIATFLTALDDKITAEKSKLTTTKQFKKALLQRMFV